MQKIKKFYTGKYDKVFKTILFDEDNKELTKKFLERLLKIKIEEIKYLKNELPVRSVEERTKIVDVLVKVNGMYLHMEINTSNPMYLHTRNLIFFETLYTKKTKVGESYNTTTKFIHIDLTYGIKNDEKEYRKYYIMDNEKRKYIKNKEIIEYNMDKIMSFWYNQNEEKIKEYRHLIMLDLKKEELERLSKGDELVKEFTEKITKLNEEETFQSAMTYEEDQKLILNTEKQIAFNDGIEQGISTGVQEKNKEVVIGMLKDNLDINLISKYTNTTIEEINKIKIENNL